MRKNRVHGVILFIAILFLIAPGGNQPPQHSYYVGGEELRFQVENLTGDIQHDVPADAVLVFVGRSLNPLGSITRGSVFLPLSDFRYLPYDHPVRQHLVRDHRLQSPMDTVSVFAILPFDGLLVQRLFRHFDQVLQAQNVRLEDGRTYYLIDYGARGGSLYSVQVYFQRYCQERGINAVIRTLLVTHGDDPDPTFFTEQQIRDMREATVFREHYYSYDHVIKLGRRFGLLSRCLFSNAFDAYSSVGQWRLDGRDEPGMIAGNPENALAFQAWMEREANGPGEAAELVESYRLRLARAVGLDRFFSLCSRVGRAMRGWKI